MQPYHPAGTFALPVRPWKEGPAKRYCSTRCRRRAGYCRFAHGFRDCPKCKRDQATARQ
jgi:hypothetical protein